jgi:hypothetical protein
LDGMFQDFGVYEGQMEEQEVKGNEVAQAIGE